MLKLGYTMVVQISHLNMFTNKLEDMAFLNIDILTRWQECTVFLGMNIKPI